MNSTMEALYFGVPLVVIPQMPEQAVTARRVVELGLGRAFLDRSEVTAESLRASVLAVLDDDLIKDKVTAMQQLVRAAGGAKMAADAVESLLTQGLPPRAEAGASVSI